MRLDRAAVACCAGNACAYAIVNTTPLVLGAMMRSLELDERAAGALMTAALLCMGLVALACAPLLTGARQRRVAVAATVVIILGESAASLNTSAAWMMLWMLAIGLGAGALLAAINAIIATSRRPEALFGYALMSAYAVAALLVLGLAPAIALAGHHGAFATLAAFSLTLLPLLRWLPGVADPAAPLTAVPDMTRPARGGPALLFGILIISVPMMGFYAFIEGLGSRLGLEPAAIARIFAAQQLASVAGALLAARLGKRLPLSRAIFIATALHSAAIAGAVLGGSPATYAIGVIAEGFSFLFLLPVLFTLAALIDTSGRWAAAANGALFVATGAAPFLVGGLIERHGYDVIAWVMVLATPPGLLAFWASAQAARQPGHSRPMEGDGPA